MDIGDKHCHSKSGLRSGNEVKDDIKKVDPIGEQTAGGPITRKYYPSVIISRGFNLRLNDMMGVVRQDNGHE